MPTVNQTNAQSLPVNFYPGRLSIDDLEGIAMAAKYCLTFAPRSRELASYLNTVVALESHRRTLEHEGEQILEVAMTAVPCCGWTNAQLVAALCKCSQIRHNGEGDVAVLFDKLHMALEVEACWRLDPSDVAGMGIEHE